MEVREYSRVAGGLLLALIVACSCGKTRKTYRVDGEFRYYNRLAGPVTVEIRAGLNKAFESHVLQPGDSMVLTTVGETDADEPAQPKSYAPGITADTAAIRFGDSFCYVEYRSGPVLHNINSYTYQQRGDRDYVFFLDIDSNLLNMARPCEW